MRQLQEFTVNELKFRAFDADQARIIYNTMTESERQRWPMKAAPQIDSAATVYARRKALIEEAGRPRAARTEDAGKDEGVWSPTQVYQFRAEIFARAGRSRMPAGHFPGEDR